MASGEREISRSVARFTGGLFALLSAFAWAAACSGEFQTRQKGGPDGGSGGSGETDGSSGGPAGGPSGVGEADGSRDGARPSGHTVNRFVDVILSSRIEKLDLLLMVDNSINMADKERLFSEAIPELVQRFTSPICTDPMTRIPDRAKTPADPTAACPAPLIREFAPIRNVHLGVITSSIGGHGSTTLCVGNDAGTLVEQEQNDHGWLVGKRPRYMTPAGGWPAESSGFLDWNPDTHSNQSAKAFGASASAMVLGAGEFGCGLESQLESIYRFLVDPNPYQTITVQNCPGSSEPCAVPTGKDASLLAQRAAFLRPDSAVVVMMITDENDCSIQESGQYYYAARDNIILPHGSSVCATNPNDKCCYFCNAPLPAGCVPDPTCSQPTPRTQDQPNLRCFHQQQRFGFDFLYPTARYVNALTQPVICTARADLAPDPANCRDLDGDRKPDLFDNPLFVGVNGTTAIPRDASLVFLGGILGVPWQDLATNVSPAGEPYPSGELHYRSANQLARDNTWSVVLGDLHPDPAGSPPIPPIDSLMLESKDPRGGNDGENPPRPLAPTSAGYLANPVNGHEWVNMDQDDLQYACIFELPSAQKRDCASAVMMVPMPGCDCKPGKEGDNNPVCQGTNGEYSTTQGFAKAYPGLRELQVLKDFGSNAIVASICPRNVKSPGAQDYGYRPAIDAVLGTVGGAFQGKCLPRMLTPDAKTGKIPCTIVEVRPDGSGSCDSTSGRSDIDAETRDAVKARLKERAYCDVAAQPSCEAFSYCQINEAGETCHLNQPPDEAGWCYIDPSVQAGDDVSLVAGCPVTQQRLIRFVDPAGKTPAPGATTLIVCSGTQ